MNKKLFIFLAAVALFTIAFAGCKKKEEKPVVLESIEVTTQPTKKLYLTGETFDPAGMVVTASYSNNTTTTVAVTAAMLTYDFSTAGTKTVTITYEGKTATVTGITVNNPPPTIKQIETGGMHTFALMSDGTLWVWGNNINGQLGDGTTTDKHSPIKVDITGVAAISARYNSMALKSDGTLWAWGGNSSGQLGDGTTTDRTTPVKVVFP
jgi:alpha-tubulin suppressor-like RCC1 family protein